MSLADGKRAMSKSASSDVDAEDHEMAPANSVTDGSLAGAPGASSDGAPAPVSGTKQKKKARLQWDEENLMSNALEKERNAYPKIDEPKTPFHTMSGSEGGSVSSGSAPHSPGSPAFISRENLIGFSDLERTATAASALSSSALSKRASSDGSTRNVHIQEDASASSGGESSPRSREEFETKRKLHYKKEHARFHSATLGDDDDDEYDEVTPDIIAARERENGAGDDSDSDGAEDAGSKQKASDNMDGVDGAGDKASGANGGGASSGNGIP